MVVHVDILMYSVQCVNIFFLSKYHFYNIYTQKSILTKTHFIN
jgi:hypothetical protein